MKIKLLAIALICAILTACGEQAAVSNNAVVTTAQQSLDLAETEPSYTSPDIDFGGSIFRILASSTTWGFNTTIDFEEQSGEMLDDAQFVRNRKLEEQFNMKMEVVYEDIGSSYNAMSKTVMAGEDAYQSALLNLTGSCKAALAGETINMREYPDIRLDEEWWDQDILYDATVIGGDRIFYAASDLSCTGLEATLAVFINEKLADDYQLDVPYQEVRDGKWTFDMMQEYAHAGANLNGDDNFKFKVGNNAIYGCTSYSTLPAAMIYAAGERMISIDENGNPYFSLETDRFYSVASKICDMLSVDGEFSSINNSAPAHYEDIFRVCRAFLCACQIKATTQFRSMDDSFGMLPIPKFDEDQSRYYSYRTTTSLASCMPVTNINAGNTAVILDALSYYSHIDVLPVFYDVTLSQKGLRNDDSIEMLNLVRDTRVTDVGCAMGWTGSLTDTLGTLMWKKDADVASKIAKELPKIEATIESTMNT